MITSATAVVSSPCENIQSQNIQSYYRFHAAIYDLTRWTFLFGRKRAVDKIPLLNDDVKKILEIGCGTGRNLTYLAQRFPHAMIVGIDISDEMMDKARKRTAMMPQIEVRKSLLPNEEKGNFDVVLMSYALTMMNPGWEDWILLAKNTLNDKGYFAVADFHSSIFAWFRRHMSNHHVRMDGHLLPELNKNFKHFYLLKRNAYFGIWQYFVFIGKKRKS